MALSIFKSSTEEPWDRFCHTMGRALDAASAEFRGRHNRRLALGSPVKVGEEGGDITRVPVEVRGGAREYAIAYLHVKSLAGKSDARRMAAVAQEAVRAAEPYAAEPPAKPGRLVITYP